MSDRQLVEDFIDRLLAADLAAQRRAELNRLRQELAKIGSVCGDCDLWMKSTQCPREVNVNGWNRGPSMADHKCSKFALSRQSEDRRARLAAQIEAREPE